MEDLITSIALYIVGVPFQIVGYLLLILVFSVPALLIALFRKIFKPDQSLVALCESSYAFLMFLYLLGIPLTGYLIWGWVLTIQSLLRGNVIEVFLVFIICPLVPFSILIAIGFVLRKMGPNRFP